MKNEVIGYHMMMHRATKLDKLADSYLDHIRIAVEAGDKGAPFRDFIDNWSAYSSETHHHCNSADRVVWFNNPDAVRRRDMLLSLPFRSRDADAVLRVAADRPNEYLIRRRAKDPSIKLIVDHAVPLAVIIRQLFQEEFDLSREGVRSHLRRLYYLGLLSDADDAKLNAAGLRSNMPPGWDGENLLARYKTAAIEQADGDEG